MNYLKRIHPIALAALAATVASAQTPAPAAPAAPTIPNPSTPAMGGSLSYPSTFTVIDGGPFGKIFVNGVLSGLGLWQDKPVPGDKGGDFDLSNGQVFLQTTKGKFQFFIQGGVYSLPSLGTPYLHSDLTTRETFSALPQGYLKYAPSDSLSFEVGKLPTLIGAESTFTFENFNINRGLLWNEENAVNRGFQGNYTKGPWTASLSWNDGFYSNQFTWLTGSLTDVVSPKDTFVLVAGGNTARSAANGTATPLALNNSDIFNLIWTHTAGQWVIEPYFQYTSVPKAASLGLNASATTSGAALLASYAFPSKSKLTGVSLPFRVEYITSSGSAASGAPNLLYGQGSNAWSFTLTPTFQRGDFFLRGEGSYVTLDSITAGDAFGAAGTGTSQFRIGLETGFIF